MGLSLLAEKAQQAGGIEKLVDQLGAVRVLELSRWWPAIARPEQIQPGGDWQTWLVLAGRGFGKTRAGSETVHAWARTGTYARIALVAATAADARDVVAEGESGVLAVSERDGYRAYYEPSKRRITWANGAMATLYSAEEPDRLRGPQHDAFWADELATWNQPQDTWDQLQFGMRLGSRPRGIITTTPRPLALLRELIAREDTHVTRGITYDNAANLPPSFLRHMRSTYEGTRLGRQEIHAEILEDNPGALWTLRDIERLRVKVAPAMRRIVIGVDPAVSSEEESDETGIMAMGVGACSALPECKGAMHAFVLDDRSGILTPAGWAGTVANLYRKWSADRVIAEINQGGQMVEATLRAYGGDERISYRGVHAARGKQTRAEPIAALYERGKVHHVGTFGKLEDQLTQWNPITDTRSPDRLDALCWAATDLMLSGGGGRTMYDLF